MPIADALARLAALRLLFGDLTAVQARAIWTHGRMCRGA